jgi:hypothetical protein
MLLGTAAATIAVSAGGIDNGAQAADAMLKKAPPIQYVRICDRYGAGFFQIPGSASCLQLRGQVQSDNDIQPTNDELFVSASKTTGSYGGFGTTASSNAANGTMIFKNQQDNWGYEVTAKPRFDARTETSMGTFRAYAELKIQLDTGAFGGAQQGTVGGTADAGAGNKSELYRAYLQWAGWTIGNADSVWSTGNFKTGDIADVIPSDKDSGWTVYYTWTPTGPGVPPVKGSAPVPDGWSVAFGADSPTKHISKNQGSGGCLYYDLALAPGSAAGAGTVCASLGTLSVPDFVARVHYEADPPGKDDQHNDQFGIGTFHVAGIYHQITQIAVGGTGGIGAVTGCGTFTCGAGPTVHDHGWGATSFLKFFVPMWSGTKLGANRASAADNIQLNLNYCVGAIEPCGVGGQDGSLYAGDAYWTGGLEMEYMDSRVINNGAGGFYNDKTSALVFNAQYHSILTDCTDPVHCLALTLEYNYTKITPGAITQNVDWTEGGLGVGTLNAFTAEISWGISRNGTTKPTWWRLDSEIQYRMVNQALPNNCNGNIGCGVAGTALPSNIAQNPNSWVFRDTLTFDW